MKKNIDKYRIDSTHYELDQNNFQKYGFDVHKHVFIISSVLILIFIIAALVLDVESTKATFDNLKWMIIKRFDFLFIWTGNILVVFCLILMISPIGKLRLAGDSAKADYSYLSWLSMRLPNRMVQNSP